AQRPDRAREVLWPRGLEMHGFVVDRMLEAEHTRVQGLSADLGREGAELRVLRRLSVERIAEERRAVLREVHADLVGAARLQSALDERGAPSAEALDHAHVRHRALVARARPRGEAFAIRRVATVRAVEGRAIGEGADGDGVVDPLDG